MNLLPAILTGPGAQAIGWTLVHFLWQGALLGAGFALARAALHRHRPEARYLAGCVTLLLMAASAVATWCVLRPESGTAASWPAVPGWPAPALAPDHASTPAGPHSVAAPGAWVFWANALLPWLTAFWIAGVSFLSLRLLGGWWQLRRLQRGPGMPVEERIGARLLRLQARLRVDRAVRVLQSAAVHVPTVLGWFRPVILLPASTLTGLSPRQLDFILAHELAHIRRGDGWVNLLQVLIETALFHHPAVWWVSRCVREEREHCCDDLALSACGDGLAGAQALAALEELRQPPPRLALAATGGSLLTRVKRLLGLPADDTGSRRRLGNALVGLGFLLMIAGALVSAGTSRYQASARIRIDPTAWSPPGAPEQFDPYRFTDEIESLRSPRVLTRVVQKLDLEARWGRDGQRLPAVQAVAQLRDALEVRQTRGTSLVEIRATAASAEEARDLANGVAEAYRDLVRESQRERSTSGLSTLERELAGQNERVRSLEQALAAAGREASDPDGKPAGTGSAGALVRSNLVSLHAQLQSQLLLHEGQREALRGLAPDALLNAVTTLVPGETLLPQLQANLAAAEQQLAGLRVDFASDHPEVRRGEAVIETIERQIDDRLHGILTALDNRIAIERTQVDELLHQIEADRQGRVEAARRYAESSQLAQDLENERRIRDALNARVLQAKVDARVSDRPPVELVDVAALPARPVSSGPATGGALFASGLLVSLSGLVVRGGRPAPATPASS